MPNWCSNNVKISGSKEQIDELEKFLTETEGKNWFDFFVEPVEKAVDAENPDWYAYNTENYGCKWNCDAQDWYRDGDTISFWFDSPWAPPIALYQSIYNRDDGYMVYAEYCEEGLCFVGRFEDGEEEYYEFNNGIEDLDDIPEDLVENWNLRESLESWEEEEDEESNS